MSYSIHYLPQARIDREKWDRCIDTATNGLVYAQSWYLDSMSIHWDALVLGDYEAVMPLCWNKKAGIMYLYQPFLAAQLGPFGKSITIELTTAFLEAIPRKFRYIDISLNEGSVVSDDTPGVTLRQNYVLWLDRSYEALFAGYKETTQRNIRKAQQLGCEVRAGIDEEQVIQLAIRQMRTQGQQEKDSIDRFRKLLAILKEKRQAIAYGVIDTATKDLLASCIFFFSHQRAYYILVGNHPEGRSTGASHLLIDGFIRDHAQQPLLLDFEGSDIPTLGFFYSSFGAHSRHYPAVRWNRLPFYLRWLKR